MKISNAFLSGKQQLFFSECICCFFKKCTSRDRKTSISWHMLTKLVAATSLTPFLALVASLILILRVRWTYAGGQMRPVLTFIRTARYLILLFVLHLFVFDTKHTCTISQCDLFLKSNSNLPLSIVPSTVEAAARIQAKTVNWDNNF